MKLPVFLSRIGVPISSIGWVKTPETVGTPTSLSMGTGPDGRDGVLPATEELGHKIFHHSNDAILVSEPAEDRFVDVNPKACTMLGYQREELLATPLSSIHPNDLALLGVFAESVFEKGTGWTNELSCVTKSGVSLPTEISASSMEMSGKLCIIALVRDISERKQSEEKLLQQTQELSVLQERNRLARELHDSVTQSLYSLTLYAEAGRRLAASGDLDRVKDYLEQLGGTAQQALKDTRLLVHQLRPVALESEGLVGALQQRLDGVEKRAGVEAKLLVEGVASFPDYLEEQMYHVALEALNNSIKHAAATTVLVRIGVDDNSIELKIEDNGVGFDVQSVGESGGMGLTNMRKRVEELGGYLTLISAPGEGTTISVTVGLPESTKRPAEGIQTVRDAPEVFP